MNERGKRSPKSVCLFRKEKDRDVAHVVYVHNVICVFPALTVSQACNTGISYAEDKNWLYYKRVTA